MLPRLTAESVYGAEGVRLRRAGAYLARPCPLHGGDGPNFHVHPEHLGWRCHSACQESGDVIAYVRRLHGLDFPGAVRFLAELAGLEVPGRGMAKVASSSKRHRRPAPSKTDRSRPSAPRAAPAPKVYNRPPPGQVAEVWGMGRPVTEDAEAADYLAGRGLAPAMIAARDLARVLPLGAALPPWASHWRAGEPRGYRLIFPLYGPGGRRESLRARPLYRREDRKALPAKGDGAGLLLADFLGLGLLAGDPGAAEAARSHGLWIAEGEPDFLALAAEWQDGPAVWGVTSGAWTAELAALVPDGARVILATDADGPGEAYATEITATLAPRARAGRLTVKRWTPRRADG